MFASCAGMVVTSLEGQGARLCSSQRTAISLRLTIGMVDRSWVALVCLWGPRTEDLRTDLVGTFKVEPHLHTSGMRASFTAVLSTNGACSTPLTPTGVYAAERCYTVSLGTPQEYLSPHLLESERRNADLELTVDRGIEVSKVTVIGRQRSDRRDTLGMRAELGAPLAGPAT